MKTSILVWAFISLSGVTARVQAMEIDSMPAVHGMFAFGEQTLYLSHMPMFMAPHDYQVIFEALFDQNGVTAYANAKKDDPDQMVTIVPEPFVLTDMITHPTGFYADLYKGHFERGGALLVKHVQVTLTAVVRAHHLGESASSPKKMIVFGDSQESYQAHFITAPPDVDQIDRIYNLRLLQIKTIYREGQDLQN